MSGPRPLHQALLVAGPPGAGKTTLGTTLARRLGAALVDLDTATADLGAVIAGLVGVDDLDDPRLAGVTRVARYETITAIAEENLRLGLGVVLVAPFSVERRDPAAWAALATRLRAAGGVPTLVWLAIDPETVARRISQRGAARDLPKIARDAGARRPDLAPPLVPHLRVDATRAPEEIADRVLASLTAPDPSGLPSVS